MNAKQKELKNEMRPKIRYWLPAAAVDENDLRMEIRDFKARGFGGVEAVVLSTTPEEIAKSEDGWGTANWNKTVDIIADETKKQGMSLDIAIGPGWPIASPAIQDVNDPASLCEMTYATLKLQSGTHYSGKIPDRRVIRKEGCPVLVTAMAYRVTDEKNKELDEESYMDLTGNIDIQHSKIDVKIPGDAESTWCLFFFYRQPAAQRINAGQTIVVDHLSREGAEACEKYWDGIFADHQYDNMESFFCDSLEYAVSMDWTPHFPEEFEKRRGYSILPYLPVVGASDLYPFPDIAGYHFHDRSLSDRINRDYLETLTQCYCENHLDTLENYAEKHKKTVRYQVAYNKPFEIERSALHAGIPENEALGRPSIDYMKTMAAAAHLGRKKRYSFECAAEFGNSYGQSYEDLLWWVKRSLMAGMNAQVLHGACYSGRYEGCESVNGQIPGTMWPGFEGFGKFVSNYWNRTLSVKDARGVLDTITRMNTIFRKHATVDCAVLRESYSNNGLASEFGLYDDGGALSNAGFSYEFLSADLLQHPNAVISEQKGHNVLDANGPAYKCLIVPETDFMSCNLLKTLKAFHKEGFPIILVGRSPSEPKFYAESDTDKKIEEWKHLIQDVYSDPTFLHAGALREIPQILKENGIEPDCSLNGDMDLITARREDADRTYFMIYALNRVKLDMEHPNQDEVAVSSLYRKGTTKGSYRRPGSSSTKVISVKLNAQGSVRQYDPFSDTSRILPFLPDGKGHMTGLIRIQEDEIVFLEVEPVRTTASIDFQSLSLFPFEARAEDEPSFLRSGFNEEKKKVYSLNRLVPWRQLDPALEHFSGKGIYSGTITVKSFDPEKRYILHLGDVCDTFTVTVNGQETCFPDQVMKTVDISSLLQEGRNSIRVTVVSNLYNRLFHEGMTSFGFQLSYVPRDYGLYESEGKEIFVEISD